VVSRFHDDDFLDLDHETALYRLVAAAESETHPLPRESSVASGKIRTADIHLRRHRCQNVL